MAETDGSKTLENALEAFGRAAGHAGDKFLAIGRESVAEIGRQKRRHGERLKNSTILGMVKARAEILGISVDIPRAIKASAKANWLAERGENVTGIEVGKWHLLGTLADDELRRVFAEVRKMTVRNLRKFAKPAEEPATEPEPATASTETASTETGTTEIGWTKPTVIAAIKKMVAAGFLPVILDTIPEPVAVAV